MTHLVDSSLLGLGESHEPEHALSDVRQVRRGTGQGRAKTSPRQLEGHFVILRSYIQVGTVLSRDKEPLLSKRGSV